MSVHYQGHVCATMDILCTLENNFWKSCPSTMGYGAWMQIFRLACMQVFLPVESSC